MCVHVQVSLVAPRTQRDPKEYTAALRYLHRLPAVCRLTLNFLLIFLSASCTTRSVAIIVFIPVPYFLPYGVRLYCLPPSYPSVCIG